MREPQEIEDEEYEQVVEQVAAVDVAKASGWQRIVGREDSPPNDGSFCLIT